MNPTTETPPPAAPHGITKNAIVFGGKQLEVRRLDGHAERVLVRLLPIDPGLITYITLAQQEAALAEFICERPAGWALELEPASLLDIVEAAHALNFSTARRWAEHRAKVAADLVPLNGRLESVREKLSPIVARASA